MKQKTLQMPKWTLMIYLLGQTQKLNFCILLSTNNIDRSIKLNFIY